MEEQRYVNSCRVLSIVVYFSRSLGSQVFFFFNSGEATLFPNEEALQRALLHWQRSANQDYAYARIKLGDYYYYGYGTTVDYEMAATQYKIASDRHQAAQAMFNLGYMHEQGLGINKVCMLSLIVIKCPLVKVPRHLELFFSLVCSIFQKCIVKIN